MMGVSQSRGDNQSTARDRLRRTMTSGSSSSSGSESDEDSMRSSGVICDKTYTSTALFERADFKPVWEQWEHLMTDELKALVVLMYKSEMINSKILNGASLMMLIQQANCC